jgi:hypothetical protein
MDEIAAQEQQGLLKRQLEALVRDGFHSSMAGKQDVVLMASLVEAMRNVCAGNAAGARALLLERAVAGEVAARVEAARARAPSVAEARAAGARAETKAAQRTASARASAAAGDAERAKQLAALEAMRAKGGV